MGRPGPAAVALLHRHLSQHVPGRPPAQGPLLRRALQRGETDCFEIYDMDKANIKFDLRSSHVGKQPHRERSLVGIRMVKEQKCEMNE